jgi:peptidoglycan hydrolase-like protein with peptidoglycan-binding domain
MRLVKKLVSGVLAALLFVLGGLAVLVAFADDDLYRWAFHRLLEGTVDREVRVDGGFSLALGLEPNLTITDLRVADASWSERDEMARVDRVEIQIALKPLFSGIVRIPLLLVEGFTLDLERNPDGDGNWNLLKTEGDAAEKTGPKDFFYPLIDHVSLKDIAVTYRDQRSGRDTEIRIARLRKQEIADESGLTLQGDGSLNRTAFQVTGRLGSVAEALAATAPFPIELTLKTLGLTAELAGTAANLPRAEGLDLRLSAQAASLAQVLETWESELLLEGRAELSAHLRGDLEALAAEDIAFRLVETSGQELDATGSLADLLQGRGLDLRVTGKLGPEALHPLGDLPAELRDVIDGIAGFDLSGRISGDLETSAFEDLRADLEHASGATLSLRGQAALGRAEGRLAFTALGVSAEFSAPDPSLLEPLLTTQIPDLGTLRATSELSLEDGRVMLSAFTAEAASFGAPRLSAKGRIGSFADGTFALDPQLDLSASLDRSRPLAALLVPPPRKAEPPAQVSPPVEKSGKELLLSIQKGLKSAGLDPGPIDGLMGPRTRAAIEAYQAAQGLTVDGRASDGLWRHLQGDSETGPPPVAQAGPSGEGLPELGPAAASGRLSGRDGAYRLDDLRLTLGAKDALWIEATGNLERLRPTAADPLGGLALAVSFTLPSSLSLPWLFPPAVPELRTITGRFDARGSPPRRSRFPRRGWKPRERMI